MSCFISYCYHYIKCIIINTIYKSINDGKTKWILVDLKLKSPVGGVKSARRHIIHSFIHSFSKEAKKLKL